MRTIIAGATVIDGTGGPVLKNARIVIERERVESVVPMGITDSTPDATLFMLDSGYTVLPGLIDCHDHVGHPGLGVAAMRATTVPHAVALVSQALRETIEAGVTTVRDAGGLAFGFKTAVEEELFVGPRLILTLAIMSRTGGLGDASGIFGYGSERSIVPGVPTGVCDGPEEARKKVRELNKEGADAIKVAMTGGIRRGALEPGFSPAEIEAIVDEAHTLNMRVLCHCHGGKGLRDALNAGVDSIDHGLYLLQDEDSLRHMADKGTFYVPTMLVLRYHERVGEGAARDTARELRAQHCRGIARAAELGVRIAMGTDAGAFGHQHHAAELELLVDAGLSPMQALMAATSSAAACVGRDREVGTLAPGYYADLIVVQGDPLTDIRVLQDPSRVKLVMKGGAPIRATLSPVQAGARESMFAAQRPA